MLREIVLDTETTGLNPKAGDRLIEIGCIEMRDRKPTGHEYHCFINPQDRDVHPDAEAVHGISTAFLADKPVFAEVVDDFLGFIGHDALVIHNAPFDIGFLNMEFERIGRPVVLDDRVIDTLAMAKRKHPAGPNTLDALCKRYGIDNSIRTKHGAIVDSLLLAEVYIELLGIRQASLGLAKDADQRVLPTASQAATRPRPQPLPPRLTADDEAAHAEFIATLGKAALWNDYLPRRDAT